MNGNYHLSRFYAQERINARLQEAQSHRLTRHGKRKNDFGLALLAVAGQVAGWIGRVSDQAARSLEKLGEARVAPLHR
jgi:hypothetical protein